MRQLIGLTTHDARKRTFALTLMNEFPFEGFPFCFIALIERAKSRTMRR